MKIPGHYFRRFLKKEKKNSIANLPDFSFPFNQGGKSQCAEQGVVKYLRLPGAEALCASRWASGWGMIWHGTPGMTMGTAYISPRVLPVNGGGG